MNDTVQTTEPADAQPRFDTQSALPAEETERLGTDIVAALKTVFDPEIPADIYELGLIYKVDIKDDRSVGRRDDAHHAELSGGVNCRPWSRTPSPVLRASVPSVSTWSGSRPGPRTGCPARRVSSSICGELRRLTFD